MPYRVSLDLAKCQGYAHCLIEAPEIWDFDEESNQAVALQTIVDDRLRTSAEASSQSCPTQAIRINDITDP